MTRSEQIGEVVKIIGAVVEEIGRATPYDRTRPISVEELDLEPPAAGELLVRIQAAGLCHSDLSVVDGHRVRPVPMLLGHEATGVVEVVGDGVADLSAGDRVIMTFLPRCGTCEGCADDGRRPCVPGSAANSSGSLLSGGRRLSRASGTVHHHLGVSGFATHAVVDRRSVVPIAADVPADVAAVMGCAVLTGGGAVLNVAEPAPGSSVAVVGLGGVGMAAVLTALAFDGVRVVAVDPFAEKLDLARRLGVHDAYTPEQAERAEISAQWVIEAVGSARVLESAIAMTAPGGSTITVGLPGPDSRTTFSPTALVADGRSIVGSYLGSSVPERDIPRFIELWRQGRLPVEHLISGRLSLDEVNLGMDRLASGEVIRQIIDFEDTPA